ncbi:MAG: PD40 domain-containing protein [Chloroflexi bacterium]|nr:PD40 domain-containing protein [Chloroflexota bacterium]
MPRGVRPSVAALAFLLLAIGCESPAPFVPQVVNVVARAAPAATPTALSIPEKLPTAVPTQAPLTATAQLPTATATAVVEATPPPAPTANRAANQTVTPTDAPATATATQATPTPFPTNTPAPVATATPTATPSPSPTQVPLPVPQVPQAPQDVKGSLTYIDGDGDLWLINADGSHKTFLARDVDPAQEPLWSAAKLRVAFREKKTINNIPVRVWRVMELDNLGRYRLVARIQDSEDFTWSPDGRSALISEPFKGFVEYNISTERTEDVFDTFGGALDRSPALSPNGKKLAFVHYELSVQYYIGMVRKYDDQLKPVTYDVSFTNYFHPVVALLDAGTAIERNRQFRFLWTPDSKRFVYAVRQPGEAFGSIYAAGTKFSTVATGVLDPAATNVDLSANGKSVVFASPQGLMTAPVEGSVPPRSLLGALVEGSITSPRWSPDDAHIAYVTDGGIGIVPAYDEGDGDVILVIPDTMGVVSIAWVPLP